MLYSDGKIHPLVCLRCELLGTPCNALEPDLPEGSDGTEFAPSLEVRKNTLFALIDIGGINKELMREFFNAGCECLCIVWAIRY